MNKQDLIEKIRELDTYGSSLIERNEVLELIRQLDEPQKVTIPQFVANWIEYCKKNNFTLLGCLDPVDDFGAPLAEEFEGDVRKCIRWCRKESNNFARAWLDGYEVEKEKRYTIRFKNIRKETRYLKYDRVVENWYFGVEQCSKETKISHTRKELEGAGFGWVFDCPGIEIEEVTE